MAPPGGEASRSARMIIMAITITIITRRRRTIITN